MQCIVEITPGRFSEPEAGRLIIEPRGIFLEVISLRHQAVIPVLMMNHHGLCRSPRWVTLVHQGRHTWDFVRFRETGAF